MNYNYCYQQYLTYVLYPTISSVTPSSFPDAATGIVIAGDGFEADDEFGAGTSKVWLTQNNDWATPGTKVQQTDTVWSNSSITFTVVQGALPTGTVYLWVENSDLEHNASGETVTLTGAGGPPSAAVTGAITPTATEAEIVSGGKTIIITLANDTWVPAGATFDAIRQNIIDGLDSGGSDLNGWNNEVRDQQGVSGLVRTSATVVTITLDGQAAYNNLTDETITVTVPAAAVNGGSLIGATPTFDVIASGGGSAIPGDYLIRRNASDSTTLVPNTGSNLDALWDTQEALKGSSISYAAGTFTLASGIYLVMYSEQFATLSTTNNERLGIHGQLVIGGSPVEEGHAHGYIRKAGGSQEAAVHGGAIVRIASDGTSLVTRFYRDDNTTAGGQEPNRVADTGGVIILALDDTHAYARYVTTAGKNLLDAWGDVVWDSNDEEDPGFSRSAASVTIADAGRYVVAYSLPFSNAAGGDRDPYHGRVELAGAEVAGTRGYAFKRSTDSTDGSSINWIGLIDAAAGNVLKIQTDR